ncbi:class C sortase [Bifidobacterium actinocoloniiforme]|nr:class C sortase [Bifidobacterium actinocoloniiforme]
MDWSVLVAVALVCMFALGYALYSGSMFMQNHNDHESTQSVDKYDQAVRKLSPKQIKAIRADIRRYDGNLRAGGPLDPFSGKPVNSQEAGKVEDYTKILGKVSPDMVGYLSVPKAKFAGPIYYGDVNSTLTRGVGYLDQTAIPADVKGTRSVLYGHTGLDDMHVFDDLYRVRKGDTFSVRVLDATYHYKVSDISTVKPTETDSLRPQKDKTIVTLLTCTPKGVNDHRLLVSGQLTDVTTDKPKLNHTISPLMLIVTAIPLALAVVGAAYVALRRQQLRGGSSAGLKPGGGQGLGAV